MNRGSVSLHPGGKQEERLKGETALLHIQSHPAEMHDKFLPGRVLCASINFNFSREREKKKKKIQPDQIPRTLKCVDEALT